MSLLNLMRNSFKAALGGLLALSLVVSSVPHASAQMGEDGLVMSVAVTGPAGSAYSVNITPGVSSSGTFSGGETMLDDVQIGFPDSLNGSFSLPVQYGGQTRSTVNLNFIWDRFAGSILFSGNLSPYAVLNVTANGTTTQLRSTEGGNLPANANVITGDFQAGASLLTIEVLNTTRASNGERVNSDPVSIAIGMGLPALSTDGGTASTGGSKGKGFNIGFAIKALFAGAMVKATETFVKSMRSMSQQETTTRMATLTSESTLNDAQEIAEDALVRQEMNARLTRELMPEEQVAIGACTIENMTEAEENARATQGVIADANQRGELLESDGRNVCARVPEDTMSDEMRRMCGLGARPTGEQAQSTLNADQYVTQTRDVTGAATEDETPEERSLRQFLDLLTDSHRPLTAVANLNPNRLNDSQYVNVLDARGLEAQQSLVKSTFHRMFADRTSGASESRQTLEDVLKRQSYDDETVNKLIGTKPSYWSQREIMAKLRYQDPNFYTELQGKSESQLRAVHASIEAQKSMVWRDLYTSVRQRELLLAQILEMKLRAQGDAVNRQLSSVSE